MRVPISFVIASSFVCSFAAAVALSTPVGAQGKKEAEASAPRTPSTPALNACGCYEDGAGQCHCVKKSKCGCPGTCEPAGCEEKRAKEMEKETRQELKRQQDEEKKRNAELEKKRAEQESKEDERRGKGLRGLRLVE